MSEHTPGSTEGPPPYENWREVPLPGKPGIQAAVDPEGELASPAPDTVYEQPEGIELASQFEEAIEEGHEPNRANLRPVVAFVVGLMIVSVIAFGVAILMVRLVSQEPVTIGPPSAGVAAAPVPAPPPNVVARADPNLEYRTMVAQSLADLMTYGWVDKDAGIARIPIDQAMQIVVVQGLPSATGNEELVKALQNQGPPPDSNGGRFIPAAGAGK